MKKPTAKKTQDLERERKAPLITPTDLKRSATKDIAGAMNAILADVFALYLKTKNFHWHMSGPHFRDYHLLLDEQADQLYAMTDPIAERIRKVGGSRSARSATSPAFSASSTTMPTTSSRWTCWPSCARTTKTLAARLREVHNVCDEHRDIATASLIEVWIDETERRTWFLFEASRPRGCNRTLMLPFGWLAIKAAAQVLRVRGRTPMVHSTMDPR